MIEREFSGKDLDSLDEEQLRKVNIGYVTNPTATCLHALFSNVGLFLQHLFSLHHIPMLNMHICEGAQLKLLIFFTAWPGTMLPRQ